MEFIAAPCGGLGPPKRFRGRAWFATTRQDGWRPSKAKGQSLATLRDTSRRGSCPTARVCGARGCKYGQPSPQIEEVRHFSGRVHAVCRTVPGEGGENAARAVRGRRPPVFHVLSRAETGGKGRGRARRTTLHLQHCPESRSDGTRSCCRTMEIVSLVSLVSLVPCVLSLVSLVSLVYVKWDLSPSCAVRGGVPGGGERVACAGCSDASHLRDDPQHWLPPSPGGWGR